jgi:hypothetical protein
MLIDHGTQAISFLGQLELKKVHVLHYDQVFLAIMVGIPFPNWYPSISASFKPNIIYISYITVYLYYLIA